ncbi:MAG: hypothetical protein RI883_1108 [Bacteroidota bacterium]|jgi:hypothetical protein
MTEAEARIFLGLENGNDPQEAFEEQLFQFKQFFTSKPIILSTFKSKLEKLKKLDDAARFFEIEYSIPLANETESFGDFENILEAFQCYQILKSILFQRIQVAYSPLELQQCVEDLLVLNSAYINLWPDTKIEASSVILSKELDPMELLADIKRMINVGIVTFTDLAKELTEPNSILKKESMRLYLLNQKKNNG